MRAWGIIFIPVALPRVLRTHVVHRSRGEASRIELTSIYTTFAFFAVNGRARTTRLKPRR